MLESDNYKDRVLNLVISGIPSILNFMYDSENEKIKF